MRGLASLIVFAALVFAPALARAELTAAERATAEALFQQGVALMEEQQYERACEKFAGTLELEQGVGTLLRLADCYDRLGRTASAWALFHDVAARAQAAGDTTREQIAVERAQDLEQRLSMVKLNLTATGNPKQLAIKLGDAQLPHATWDSPIPVDPGRQSLQVSAPGYEPWSGWIAVLPGPSLTTVQVPRLKEVSASAPKPVRTTPTPPLQVSSDSSLPNPDERSTSSVRTAGYVATVLGVVGLAAAGLLAYRAKSLNERSLESCRPESRNACTIEGVKTRNQAQDLAMAATIVTATAGAATLAGLTVLLLAPPTDASNPREQARIEGFQVQFTGGW